VLFFFVPIRIIARIQIALLGRQSGPCQSRATARRIAVNVAKLPDWYCIRDARLLLGTSSASAAHEILHFLQGNGAIFIGIHSLEDALVSRLKLLQ